ncbi:MAG TPA: DUF1015 domain-containing protein [Syntrophorhabdales bacterium]|nr:DUF1015 domain-containing protein [Syntrophorhabdales bacterium]
MPEPLIRPFKGLIYNRRKIDDISRCVCPPYDIIPDPRVYYQRSAFNAVRLELPLATPSTTEYDEAARTLEAWLREEILTVDATETIYIYEQEFTIDGTTYVRRGLIPLVNLGSKRILTHEETRKAAREDRERLIQRLKTFTSLIFALYDDKQKNIENLLASSDKELIYDFSDELSITNRFYRMSVPGQIRELTALMEDKRIYIADGHHRLSVAFKLGLPYVAMYVADMYSEGIVILPYHRLVRSTSGRTLAHLLERVKGLLQVERVALTGPEKLGTLIRNLASGPNPSFGLFCKDDKAHVYILSQRTPFFTDEAVPESLRKLSVNIAHAGLLKGLFGIKEEDISFVNDAAEAVQLVNEGKSDLAFFVPPTTVDEVRDVAEHGLYMPPKSTYFFPKVLSGLVFHRYA